MELIRAGSRSIFQRFRVLYMIALQLLMLLLGCSAFVAPAHTADRPPRSGVEGVTPSTEPLWVRDFVTYIEEAIVQDHIPGLALALVRRDETLLVQGFGLRNVATSAPVTPDTLFHIGSTHKSMTAMLIATLVDKDTMAWDRPVAPITEEFALSDSEATASVTIRHLLSMRAGIPADAEDNLPDDSTPQDVFAVVADTDLLGPPGQQFDYSNLSTAISGYLGVLAAGGSFDNLHTGYADLLQENILTPIGMDRATIHVRVAQRDPNHSLSYAIAADGRPVLTPTFDVDGDALAPSGSLKASAAEMALYVRTQMAGGAAPNGTRIVSEANLAETWQPYLENYAMGWERITHQGVDMIYHDGAYDDFVSVIGFLPDHDVGLVILINSEDAGSNLISAAPKALVEILRRQRSHTLHLPVLVR